MSKKTTYGLSDKVCFQQGNIEGHVYRNIFAHVQYSFAVFSENMRNQLAVSVDYKGNRLLPTEKYYFGQNIDIFI